MLYRFRSTEKLLKLKELEEQYFYFCSPDAQNDPMEGYIDYYWKGDKIIWLGLFKNYVWQVFMTLYVIPLKPEVKDLERLFLSRSEIQWSETKLLELRHELETEFANDSYIIQLAETLGNLNEKVHATELKTILNTIHRAALVYANKILQRENISPLANNAATAEILSLEKAHDLVEKTITLIKNFSFFKVYSKEERLVINQTNLLYYKKDNDYLLPDNDRFISILFSEFAEIYVQQLPRLTYPEWRCVCFNRDCSNPALWGYYADGHKGICLIFDEPKDNKFTLNNKDDSSSSPITTEVKDIIYGQPPISVDFFQGLGWLFGDERKHWFTTNEEKSTKLNEIFADIDAWRDSFITTKNQRSLLKGSDWASEKECRIIIDNEWHKFNESSKYVYDFNNLSGVIFGIKTSDADKAHIITIIQDKCKEYNRDNFDFYQAEYDITTEKIDINKISLLPILKK